MQEQEFGALGMLNFQERPLSFNIGGSVALYLRCSIPIPIPKKFIMQVQLVGPKIFTGALDVIPISTATTSFLTLK